MTLLLAIWITGAVVLWLTLWLNDEFDFGNTGDLGFVIIISFAWPISLGLAIFDKFQAWRNPLLVALVLTPALAFGQAREEKTNSLTYHGVDANAQTKPENHTMNRHPTIPGWGGCAPSSVRTAALHAGIPRDQVDHFWRIAQQRVGVRGTDPQLLAEMVNEAFPGEKWTSYFSGDPTEVRNALDTLSGQGHCLAAWMGWGAPELYGNQKIAHFVNVDHFSTKDDLACVEDNNDPPGVYRWMTSSEYVARCLSQNQAWIFSFQRLPSIAQIVAATMMIIAAAILLLATSAMLVGWRLVSSP